ncbi:DUF4145 domain-containing protein [Corallibacter vietnamensis]|uniref:DUF4145 domain-containing protein n=1 Tax=Corallibacter vietnamensis TaxID=904130 RepID=A0ABP7HAT9_9FLAO
MDIEIWTKRHFTAKSKIEWNCPNCGNNTLQLVSEDFKSEETVPSKDYRAKNDDWEIEWISLTFNGRLKCKTCSENVFFTGIGNPEHSGYYDYELDDYHEEYTNTFTPTFFQPTINIFNIPKKCPDTVKEQIWDSFKLFWCDLSSCANKIRIALEVLLNEEKVKRFEVVSGKRKPISLHRRIQSYSNIEVRDLFLAIKWIGNTGSHTGEVETIDIIETYKLLEYSLKKLYTNEEEEIKKITKEINKRKGTRKRK